jgi:FMN phosphatase YigB (HAD superfamily)
MSDAGGSSALPAIGAVFCDVGGPIYDDENFVAAVLRAADELRAADGLDAVDRARFRAIYDDVREAQGGVSLRASIAREFLGSESRKRELHDLTRDYWAHPVGTMYDDVLPFFEALAGRVKIGILANQEESVIRSLERDGLAPYIDVWGVSAVVGYEKPSPELFEWALAAADVPASRAVHIGNRLDTDVRPAAALGLSTVWVLRGEAPSAPTPEQLAEPDIAVWSLDGLAERIFAELPVAR